MKIYQKSFHQILIIISLLLLINSCSSTKESPVIYFSNVSPEIVKNIECSWNENTLSLASLNPGDTRSQSFYIDDNQDFFGPVYITWYNANNEKISKNFNFNKENLPSINDHTTYNYIQLYFDQSDIEVTSSDVADLTGKIRRMELIMNKYHDDFLKRGNATNVCANNDLNICPRAEESGLITIKKRYQDNNPGIY
jgi:hypothetical protein